MLTRVRLINISQNIIVIVTFQLNYEPSILKIKFKINK